MIPGWLHLLPMLVLTFGFLCALIIAIDVMRQPQQMRIMVAREPAAAAAVAGRVARRS